MQLPNDFILQMKDIIGDENSRRLCDALAEKATVSIRLNRAKTSDIPFDTDTVGKPVAWCNDGFYLKERPLFTLDPLLHAGAYYVQEASSMFLSHVVGTLLGKRKLLTMTSKRQTWRHWQYSTCVPHLVGNRQY